MQDFINGKRQKESGFTIIEVVLVLAIAGLIFLIVFLALPQLQRSRRDTQRRGDAGKILSALESYASNSGGEYPQYQAELDAFHVEYVEDKILGPEGEDYTMTYQSTVPADANSGTPPTSHMSYSADHVCDGGDMDSETGERNIAVLVKLEEGQYCQDNQ